MTGNADAARENAWHGWRGFAGLLMVAVLCGGLAVAGILLTREEGRIAAVWLPNAFLLAVLLRQEPGRDGAILVAGFAANLIANLLVGDTGERAALLALANGVEVAVACFATRWASGARPDMTKLDVLARFMAVGGIVAPAVSATLAAVALAPPGAYFVPSLWLGWFVADGLGLLIATPSLLIVDQRWRTRVPLTRAGATEWAVLSAGGTLLTALVFSQDRFPFLFLISPIVLVYAFMLGAVGTAVGTATIAIIASIATSFDTGPIHLVQGDLSLKLMVLQAFLVTSFMMGMPVAAALEGRDRDRSELRRHREMSASMLENMREVVFRTDAKGRWIFLNPAWEQLTGYSVADSLGQHTTRLLHPADLPTALATYARIVSGEIDECLLRQRFTTASGMPRQIELSVRALRGRSGRFKGTIGNFRDVTDRETSIAELAEREAQLALLATNATDAIFRLGLDGTCLYASPSTRDLLGVEQSHLVGANVLTRFHPDDNDRVVATHRRLAAGEIDRLVVRYRTQPFYGPVDWIWLEANCGLVRDPATGAPMEIIASIRDISERKTLEFALEAARAHAEAAAAAKSTFLANMSHEIRTPMTGVIGFTDLLLEGDLSGDQRHHAEMIAGSGRSLMRLLNDILDISKVEAGQMRIVAEAFDLHHAMRSSLRLVASVAEQKGVLATVTIAPDVPGVVTGDSLRLRQIVLNLLSNAVKFTSAGEVSLDVRSATDDDGHWMEVSVTDTGIGIPPDRLDAILKPFEQGDDSTARRFGGTGLGLTISDQLARLMDGSIAVVSEVGCGTRFTLRVPLVPGTMADAAPAVVQPVERRSTASTRILVAEDHDVNQILMRALLERLGHSVDIAVDGAEAVSKTIMASASGSPYALVFMDMQMPLIDGLEATRLIREQGITPAQLPIVALTANAFAEDVDACLAAGMQAHVAKPIQQGAIEATIARWVSGRDDIAEHRRAEPSGVPAGLEARYAARREEALEMAAAMVREGRFEDTSVRTLTTALHQLAGTAGMFGEAELGEASRELELQLATATKAECAAHARKFLYEHRRTTLKAELVRLAAG